MAAKADGKDDADFSDNVNKRIKPDGDRFNRKLDTLFKILTKSPHSLRDDTFLEKLQDGITKHFANSDDAVVFSKESFVTIFIQSCTESKCTAAVGAFALRLMGHLGYQEFRELGSCSSTVSNLYLAMLSSPLWKDASIRNAWCCGLSILLESGQACDWITKTELLPAAVGCMGDSSIFVRKSAQPILVNIITHLVMVTSRDEPGLEKTDQDLEETKLQDLLNLLLPVIPDEPDTASLDSMVAHLSVLDEACGQYPLLGNFLLSNCNIIQVLCDWIVLKPDEIHEACLSLIQKLYQEISIEEEEYMVEQLPQTLLRTGHVSTALKTAASIVKFSKEQSVREVLLLPLMVVLNKQSSVLSQESQDIVGKKLDNRNCCIRIVTQAVNLIKEKRAFDESTLQLFMDLCKATLTRQFNNRSGHLTGSLKVQKAVINALYETCNFADEWHVLDAERQPVTEMLQETFHVCVQLLQDPASDPPLLSSTFKCTAEILKLLKELLVDLTTVLPPCQSKPNDQQFFCNTDPKQASLQGVINKRLCDMKWEVRDSAVEFIGFLAIHVYNNAQVLGWLLGHKLHMQAWQSVKDGESYVRATALIAVARLSCPPISWAAVENDIGTGNIVDVILRIIRDDTEAFARRAAIDLFLVWQGHDRSSAIMAHHQAVFSGLREAIHDFDWEVKLRVLKFWDHVIDDVFKAAQRRSPSPNLEIDDFSHMEGPVPSKRRRLDELDMENHLNAALCEICQAECDQVLWTALDDYDLSVQNRACELLFQLKERCRDHGARLMTRLRNELDNAEELGQSSSEEGLSIKERVWNLMTKLRSTDFETLLNEKCLSTDKYSRDLESLLDDMLASAGEQEEEVTIDCY